jgi:hypothetical protein
MTVNIRTLLNNLEKELPFTSQVSIKAYASMILGSGSLSAPDVYAVERVRLASSGITSDVEFSSLNPSSKRSYESIAAKANNAYDRTSGADTVKLRKILDNIWMNKKLWSQTSWCSLGASDRIASASSPDELPPCGTSFCFAGWDAFMFAPEGSKISRDERVITVDGGNRSIMNFAEEDLRLTPVQTEILFSGANSFEDLEDIVTLLEEDPGLTGNNLYQAVRGAANRRAALARASSDRWEEQIR